MAEVIMRFEASEGRFIAWRVNGDAVGIRAGALTPMMLSMTPKLLQPLLEGFLFGMRHGPLQRMLKQTGLPPLQAFEDAYQKAFPPDAKQDVIKNAATLDALARCVFQALHARSVDEHGVQMALDINAGDLAGAYEGVISRAPEWDGVRNGDQVVVADTATASIEAASTAGE